jgi:hypothetical protein
MYITMMSGMTNHVSHFRGHFAGLERLSEKPAAERDIVHR